MHPAAKTSSEVIIENLGQKFGLLCNTVVRHAQPCRGPPYCDQMLHGSHTTLFQMVGEKQPVIALTLHANFTPFIDQLGNTFFLTFFPLHQDFHEDHEIPEDHIHLSDIQQTPTTNLRSGNLRVHYRACPTTHPSSHSLWEPPLPDPSAILSEISPPQPPD